MFYVRISFYLNKANSFQNLSDKPVELFSLGDAKCTAKIDNRNNRGAVILECGGFSDHEKAHIVGTNLIRCIKLTMINKEVPITISGGPGLLDDTAQTYTPGMLTEHGKQFLRQGGLFGIKIPNDIKIEDDYIGMRVFEVNESMREIRFFAQEIEAHINQNFALNYSEFSKWNNQMDVALSLLNASISVNDDRVKFLLRLMSIEALVSDSQLREPEYQTAIDLLSSKIDEIDITKVYKERLKSQLGMFREKSISQKVTELLNHYLQGNTYIELPPKQFFSDCYKYRSSFVHSGSLGDIDLFATNQALKQMCLDLLWAISVSQST